MKFKKLSEFAKERVKVEGRAAFLKMRIQKQMDTELTNYVDWIFTAEQAILSEQKTTELERRHIMDSKNSLLFMFFFDIFNLNFFLTSFLKKLDVIMK